MSPPTPPTRILIIGSGVVGSSLAATRSALNTHHTPRPIIQVLSPPLTTTKTSTSLAPGLIGQLNALPALTTLAKSSVASYRSLPAGAFSQVGGLEIASTPAGIAILEERLKLAHKAGLEAKLLSSGEAAKLAPQFHTEDAVSKALYFPSDGVAEPSRIVEAFQASARAQGVEFIEGIALRVKSINGVVTGVETSTGFLAADKVIVASGIWTPKILEDLIHLPIIPVAHPYIYGPARPERKEKSPFVRWPEKAVYGRDHGACEGFGTYDHAPIPFSPESSAEGDWEARFDDAVARAVDVFPAETKATMTAEGGRRLNGVFAVTPDGLPLVGPVKGVKGLWVAAGVWVTHAGGVAGVVGRMVLEELEEGERRDEEEEGVRKAVNPGRFEGSGEEELRKQALRTYNDIYNLEE